MTSVTDDDITVENIDIAPTHGDAIKLIIDGVTSEGTEVSREVILSLKHATLLSAILPEDDPISVELRAYLGEPGRAPD
jgi:hypothetical protein